MSDSPYTIICPICHVVSEGQDALRCGCGYPRHLLIGPTKPEQALPHPQLWVASARHKTSGALVAGWLVQIKGFQLKVFDLFIGDNEIGRESDYAHPDILIYGDGNVSREHATIHCSVDHENRIQVKITDKSTQGTFIDDGEGSITVQVLHDGVKISMGVSALVFKSVYMATSHQDALQQVNNASKYTY